MSQSFNLLGLTYAEAGDSLVLFCAHIQVDLKNKTLSHWFAVVGPVLWIYPAQWLDRTSAAGLDPPLTCQSARVPRRSVILVLCSCCSVENSSQGHKLFNVKTKIYSYWDHSEMKKVVKFCNRIYCTEFLCACFGFPGIGFNLDPLGVLFSEWNLYIIMKQV